jgi:hypothetical protein
VTVTVAASSGGCLFLVFDVFTIIAAQIKVKSKCRVKIKTLGSATDVEAVNFSATWSPSGADVHVI